jgi:hypothetical protein
VAVFFEYSAACASHKHDPATERFSGSCVLCAEWRFSAAPKTQSRYGDRAHMAAPGLSTGVCEVAACFSSYLPQHGPREWAKKLGGDYEME